MLRLSLPVLTTALLLTARCAAQEQRPPLIINSCDLAAAGQLRETVIVKEGTGALRWRNHPQNSELWIRDIPHDWTGYHQLRFWVYAAAPVPGRVMLLLQSENPDTEGADYWGYKINLHFKGWREVILPIGDHLPAREPRGWDQIDAISFRANGWGNTARPEADLVIDDFRLAYAPPQPGPRMSDSEFYAALDLSRPGLEGVRSAVAKNDHTTAAGELLAHMRERTAPVWHISRRDRPEPLELTPGTDGWDYFASGFTVDWTGWREVILPLDQWKISRRPQGWRHISELRFTATYGNQVPDPETVLVFDDVTLDGDTPLELAQFETPADFMACRELRRTTAWARNGQAGGRWDVAERPNCTWRSAPRDWRPYRALRFWIHSAAATGDRITAAASSELREAAAADQVLQHRYGGVHLGEDIDWKTNPLEPGNPAHTREWTYGLNRFVHWDRLGEAYWVTGDERYAREWIAQMHDWVEDNPWPLWGTGNESLTWRTIEAGIRMSTSWPNALEHFLDSPSLTGEDMVVFLKSWIEHAHHLMRVTVEYPDHQGNWVTMECNGLGHIGILLPECRDAPTWLQTAVDRLTLELDRQVYPEGAQKELTTGYHQVSLQNFLALAKLARMNDAGLPDAYLEKLERMYDYNLKCMMPNGTLPPLNDAHYTDIREILKEGADLFGRADFLWGATLGASGTPLDLTSMAFPYAGQYVMRSGWQPDDRYLLFEAGPFGIGHQHEDKLSMVIYAYGRPVLTEAGTYRYDSSPFRRYVLGTWAHNTVLIDGLQQKRRGLVQTYETDRPLDNLWLHSQDFDAADGVYTQGYGPKREVAATHERTVVFVRPDYWVVLDRLTPQDDAEHRYDILWHLNSDRAEQDPGNLAAWGADAGLGNLHVIPARRADLQLDIVKGREEPVLGFAPASRRRPIPVLDYSVRAAGPVEVAWVLTPFRGSVPHVEATLHFPLDGGTAIRVIASGRTRTVRIGRRVNGGGKSVSVE